MAYVGDTRSRKLLKVLRSEGIGQVIVRGRLGGRRLDRWLYDNGAFEDWKAKRTFDGRQFLMDLRTIADSGCHPDAVVLPDIVADDCSLPFSMTWLDKVERLGLRLWPMYLAVQNGMVAKDVPWHRIDAIFIGGTLDWKCATAEQWVRDSHSRGLPCHYARCGTARRVSHAKAIGADSLDSCLPLWGKRNLRVFLDALKQEQLELLLERY